MASSRACSPILIGLGNNRQISVYLFNFIEGRSYFIDGAKRRIVGKIDELKSSNKLGLKQFIYRCIWIYEQIAFAYCVGVGDEDDRVEYS